MEHTWLLLCDPAGAFRRRFAGEEKNINHDFKCFLIIVRNLSK